MLPDLSYDPFFFYHAEKRSTCSPCENVQIRQCLIMNWWRVDFCCTLRLPQIHQAWYPWRTILPSFSTKMYIVSVVFRHIYNILHTILYILCQVNICHAHLRVFVSFTNHAAVPKRCRSICQSIKLFYVVFFVCVGCLNHVVPYLEYHLEGNESIFRNYKKNY